ncbi:MAG: uroporphyrinogen-III C-methyltransferase [Thermogutta sp.]|nr:uroporphyrinogen-III C-methyltransferase [Thermogutta sp.]
MSDFLEPDTSVPGRELIHNRNQQAGPASVPADEASASAIPEGASLNGCVYLVGAGPGDPQLLTLWAADILRKADLVLYDYLVDPRVLELVPPKVEKVSLGHHSLGHHWTQDEINRRILQAAAQGKMVVRLKSGDPVVFGRQADEAEVLRKAGLRVVIIPGITAGLAVGALGEIPLTHAQFASAVALVTGQQSHESQAALLNYQSLAGFPGTLVFYMGVRSASVWATELMRHGKPAETPVVLVRRCGRPNQQTVHTSLGEIASVIERRGIKPPAVIVVGEAARHAPARSWFVDRPLFGRCCVVTRPEHQVGKIRDMLVELGAEVLTQPAVEIVPPDDWAEVDAAIADLAAFDWVVFSSANGVRFFFDRIRQLGRDARAFGAARIAAIGPGTAEELQRFQIRADLLPPEFRAESLAETLSAQGQGRRYLLVRASRGRPTLAEALVQAGKEVKQVVAYVNRDIETPNPDIVARIRDGSIHWMTVTSSSIAASLVRLFGENLRRVRLASISPVTSDTLRGLGFEPTVEAKVYTMPGIVDAIRQYETKLEGGAIPPAP